MTPTHNPDNSHRATALRNIPSISQVFLKRIAPLLAATLGLALMCGIASAATYYSQGSVAPNTLANWNTNRLGGGAAPASFVVAGDIFVIQGTGNGGTSPHSMTTSA